MMLRERSRTVSFGTAIAPCIPAFRYSQKRSSARQTVVRPNCLALHTTNLWMPFSSPLATRSMKRRWAPFHVKRTRPCSLELSCNAPQNVRNWSTGKRIGFAPCALDHATGVEIGVQAHGGGGELLVADQHMVGTALGAAGRAFLPMHAAFVQCREHADKALHQWAVLDAGPAIAELDDFGMADAQLACPIGGGDGGASDRHPHPKVRPHRFHSPRLPTATPIRLTLRAGASAGITGPAMRRSR